VSPSRGTDGAAADVAAEDEAQESLFEIEPLWCLDTNVVVSFLREDDEEAYSRQVLPEQWRAFERDIATGLIIAPLQIRDELEGWCNEIPDMRNWLATHGGMFRDLNPRALAAAKRVVNAYPAYASSRNYLGDLCVIAMAASLGLTVISNEKPAKGQPSRNRPKIPDVCAEMGVGFVSVIGYLRRRLSIHPPG
jgi:hypothetical protein